MSLFRTATIVAFLLVSLNLHVTHADGTGTCKDCETCGATAAGEQSCLKCKPGFTTVTVLGQYAVLACIDRVIPNCKRYAVGLGSCYECDNTTKLYDGKCFTCDIDKCEQCSDTNKCVMCQTGFQVSTSSKCVTRMANCDKINDNGQCEGCSNGFSLVNGGCVQCAVDKCKKCDKVNHCSECDSGLTPIDGTCITGVDGCETYKNGVCVKCKDMFTLYGSVCIPCDTNSCEQCEVANVCVKCKSSYDFATDLKTCVLCNIEFCESCTKDGKCYSCKAGYGVSEGKCVKCMLENCILCSTDAQKCEKYGEVIAEEKKGIPWWVWLIVGLGAAALIGVILFIILWCCLRKPVVPVTVYEQDNYVDSDKSDDDAGSVATRDLDLDFNNRSFFARPPPIFLINDYVQPRIFTQDNAEVHGDLLSTADSSSSGGSTRGDSKSNESESESSRSFSEASSSGTGSEASSSSASNA
ncbi:Gal/GalNAc lectin Igl2 [Angomonas deanei]|uniref:Uncharacterized protein n=1 Tax=Angomonas deanei TaxID=59799 RepID=A0A7G2CE79_9TRYP|nr:Gal/GalNAc lectin Igl2 [Angomonas deanei]CAD2216462.1 hypothetical protein, conserved [Angomonas deanei]|eukprot:EPY20648.1 Gal/GalNAc lectin Igl2 [Angomonas deanei]